MANQGNDKPGRSLEQQTRDGTSSAASVGTGGTGRSDTDKGYDEAVNTPWVGGMQSAGRTDDLLSDGSEADQDGQGYASGKRPEELMAGQSGSRGGAGAGNRQSEEQKQSLSGGGRASDPTGLQGAEGNQQAGDGSQQGQRGDQSR